MHAVFVAVPLTGSETFRPVLSITKVTRTSSRAVRGTGARHAAGRLIFV